jgi:hypothetical protein
LPEKQPNRPNVGWCFYFFMKGGVMNTFWKAMLLSTLVVGVSSDLAEGRQRWVNYNHKAWADAHRETPHVGSPENYYRRGGNSGQVIARREVIQSQSTSVAEPMAVAQAQTERRAFSFDDQQANAEVRTERATENAQAADTQVVGAMQPPSEPRPMSVSNDIGNNFSGSSYTSGTNYTSGSTNTPRYALPKTDPRKYRTN